MITVVLSHFCYRTTCITSYKLQPQTKDRIVDMIKMPLMKTVFYILMVLQIVSYLE